MKSVIDCLCYYLILVFPLRWTEADCHPIISEMIARAGDWAYRNHDFSGSDSQSDED